MIDAKFCHKVGFHGLSCHMTNTVTLINIYIFFFLAYTYLNACVCLIFVNSHWYLRKGERDVAQR